jgi:DNA repair exonuclease SbcCD nuclease subunit
MRLTFIHTADWQIGKRFGAFPADKAAVLRAQRLDAVDRVAAAAQAAGASFVLVAGDVLDSETLPDTLAGQLLSRLKGYPKLFWHLLPGNHDPARAGGVWEGIIAAGLPGNVRVHASEGLVEIAPGIALLAAPLVSKSTSRDPTAFMDAAASPAGSIRIGLAHGSVQSFGSAGDANVPIDPARAKSAGLSYLALGDWHGTTRISDRVWYSGTPEPDGFRDNEPGHVLAVTIDGAGAVPKVERVATAHFTWLRRQHRLERVDGLAPLEAEVDAFGSSASRNLMALALEGLVTLGDFALIEQRLAKLAPQLFHLQSDTDALKTEAATADLDALGAGVLGTAAQRLRAASELSGEDAATAQRALRMLFALARRAEAEGAQ